MNPVLFFPIFFFTVFFFIITFAPDEKQQQVKLDPNLADMFLCMGGIGVLGLVVVFAWSFIPKDKKNEK